MKHLSESTWKRCRPYFSQFTFDTEISKASFMIRRKTKLDAWQETKYWIWYFIKSSFSFTNTLTLRSLILRFLLMNERNQRNQFLLPPQRHISCSIFHRAFSNCRSCACKYIFPITIKYRVVARSLVCITYTQSKGWLIYMLSLLFSHRRALNDKTILLLPRSELRGSAISLSLNSIVDICVLLYMRMKLAEDFFYFLHPAWCCCRPEKSHTETSSDCNNQNIWRFCKNWSIQFAAQTMCCSHKKNILNIRLNFSQINLWQKSLHSFWLNCIMSTRWSSRRSVDLDIEFLAFLSFFFLSHTTTCLAKLVWLVHNKQRVFNISVRRRRFRFHLWSL